MKNFYSGILLLLVLLMGPNVGWGQQVIGSFPNTDGGFEGQVNGTISTLSSIGTGVQRTDWTVSAGSGSATINATGGRSGPKYLTIGATSATARRYQSPTAATTVIASATAFTIQFFYKTSSATAFANGQVGNSPDGTGSVGTYVAATMSGTSNVWSSKVQISATTGSSVVTPRYGLSIFRVNGISIVDSDIDDFVMYAGAADNTSANSPGVVTVNNPSTSSLDLSWGGASGGVDGGGYVVVRYAVNPAAADDPNQNGIYAVGNTFAVTNTGTVRYIGTGTSFTDNVGLSAATTYYYKVYTVDKAFNYSTEVQGSGTTATAAVPVVSSGSTTGTVGTIFTTYNLSSLSTNSPTGYTLTAGALPAGLTLNLSTGAITGTPTAAGSYSIDFTATNASGTSVSSATLSFTIAKGNQTINFAALANKIYGDANFGLTATASSGLAVTYSSASPTVASVSGSTVTVGIVGSSVITASQAGDANWNAATDVNQTQTVTQKSLTITGLTGANKIYDATTTATTTGTAALSGVLVGDVGNVTLGGTPVLNFNTAAAGAGKPITVTGYTISGTASGNYSLTQPSLSAAITAKPLTITGVTANNKVFDGGTAATLSGTAVLNGVIAADISNVILGGSPVATFASSAIANNIAVSVVGYTISGTASGNYTISQPTGLTANITPIPYVDFANIQFPGSGSMTIAGSFTIYAQAYEPGVTDIAGQASGLTAEIGYSTTNQDPSTGTWTWLPTIYNGDVGNNDEYYRILSGLPTGTYYYASRFQLTSGGYRYGGYSSTGGGFWNGSTIYNGILTVDKVDFCNLQTPATGTNVAGNNFDVYAQVYEAGVTPGAGLQGAGIQAWIGYSLSNTNPNTAGWTWTAATFNSAGGGASNDEYSLNLGALLTNPGTYYYASRFQLNGGAYDYGGILSNGSAGSFWDGVTYISGVLTVTGPEINIQGNSVSIPDGTAATSTTNNTDFGTICEASSTVVNSFTIQNTGTSALAIVTITIAGTNASDFTITTPPAASVAAGASTTFNITFNPSAPGARTATISIVNDDLNENPYDFVLSGTGTAATTPAVAIAITTGANPMCSGINTIFTATPSGLGTSTLSTYQWTLNGGNVGTNSNTYSNNALANGNQVNCIITVTGGCVTSNTATQASPITMVVTTTPAQPTAIVGSANVYPTQTGVSYSVTNTAGVTYNWTYSGTGHTITGNGSNAITIDFAAGATNGTLTVTPVNGSCSGLTQTLAINVGPINDLCSSVSSLTINAAATNETFTGATTTAGNTFVYAPTKKDVWYKFTPVCTGNHTITINFTSGPDIDFDVFSTACPITGTAPVIAHSFSTTSEIITASFTAGTTYYIRAIDYNTNASTFTIQVTGSIAAPATPGTITQPAATPCASSTGNTYSIVAVSGAASYTWSVTGAGWAVTAGGTSISATITAGTVAGTVSVTATNPCGTSSATTTGSITPNTVLATPGTITQPAGLLCEGSTANQYSITAVAGATSYTWSVTGTGWSVASGGTTTTALINIGTGTGTVNVTANNICGASAAQTTGNITPTPVATAPLATAGTVVTANDFTVNWNPVAGATGYYVDVYTLSSTVIDDFTDGNFTATPAWSGDAGNYAIQTAITLPLGAATTDGSYLGSNTNVGNSVLSTPSTETGEWKFSLGSPDFAPSSTNSFGVILMSNSAITGDIDAASFNGYFLRIGVNGTPDYVELWRSNTTTQVKLGSFSAPDISANALRDGLNLRVTRSAAGVFQLYYSTGFTFASTPTTSAGTITDNTHSISSYFGVFTNFSSLSNDRRVYIDNIVLGTVNYVPGYQNVNTTNNYLDVASVAANTTYYYVVRAENSCGISPNSNVISVLTVLPCVATATVTSFMPTTGTAGTLVTITGTGLSTATSVKFGTIPSLSITVVNATTIIAEVPSGANTGKITVVNSGCDAISVADFTIITQTGTCGTATVYSDLFISEVYDAVSGSLGYVEIYNGTSAAVDLAAGGYQIKYFTGATTTVSLTGIIPVGGVFILRTGTGTLCSGLSPNQNSSATSGFNDNDDVDLYKSGTLIDHVRTINNVGFSMSRNAAATAPSTTYISGDWTTNTTENCGNLGIVPYTVTPKLTITQPADDNGCDATISFSVTPTTNPSGTPTYVWKFNDPATMTGWDNVSAMTGSPYNYAVTITGTGSNSISITGATAGMQNFQFYVVATYSGCTQPSNAAQYKYITYPRYQSKATGNWLDNTKWQMYQTIVPVGWIDACSYPTASNSSEINILNTHTITLDLDNTVNKLTVDAGGTLTNNSTNKLTVNNAVANADFIVNGTYQDNSGSANTFTLQPSATWQLGSTATIIKTNLGGGSDYRDAYEGGITGIPATANWIYRHNSASGVNFVGSSATTAMYYPNLTLDNTQAGTYASAINTTTPALSVFTMYGLNNSITIKGNFDVGGTGPGFINMSNISSFANLKILKDLVIKTGSTLTLASADATNTGKGFDVGGNLTINGTLNATVGTTPTGDLVFNGTATQDITGTGTMNLEDVAINNTTGTANVTVNKNFDIPGTLSFGNAAAKLSMVAGNITLKSSISRTANVGIIPTGASILYPGAGRFVVERYINSGTGHPKSWQYVATPTFGQTVNQSWQEGALTPNANPNPGYGTQITSPLFGGSTGFDVYTLAPSMKSFTSSSGLWTGIANTGVQVNNKKGYMLFVRGDRSTPLTATTSVPTIIRTTGKIYQPSQAPPQVDATYTYESVGNPYASPISLEYLFNTAPGVGEFVNLAQSVTVWDPELYGNYTVGGYQTIAKVNGYIPVPGGTSIYPGGTIAFKDIQSGQAFFVQQSGGAGSITFSENAKSSTGRLVNFAPSSTNNGSAASNSFAPNSGKGAGEFFRTSLYTSTGLIADGNVVAFAPTYDNAMDADDARKLFNSSENFTMLRNGNWLAVEARSTIRKIDTIYYAMYNLKRQAYQLRFAPENMQRNNLSAYLVDNYLKSRTPISLTDSSFVNISLNADAASAFPNRFYVVFEFKQSNLPNNPNPETIPKNLITGADKKTATDAAASISVYPNPVEGKQLHLQLAGFEKGNYRVELNNQQGQLMYSRTVQVNGAAENKLFKLPASLSAGQYQLNLIATNGSNKTLNLVIQ